MARRGAPERPKTDATPPSRYAAGDVRTTDWPMQAADQIERLVGVVRDNTTGKAITAARGLVFGVFALLAGTVVSLFFAIAAVRVLVAYLPGDLVGEQHVWLAHALVGLLFTLPGLWLLRRARRPAPPLT